MSEAANCSRCLEPLDGRPTYPVPDGHRVLIIHLWCHRAAVDTARVSGEVAVRQLDEYRARVHP